MTGACANCGRLLDGMCLIGLKHYCDECAHPDYDDEARQRDQDEADRVNDAAEARRKR